MTNAQAHRNTSAGNSPRRRPSFFVAIRSAVQWALGGTALTLFAVIMTVLCIFIKPPKLHPVTRLLTRILSFLSGAKLRVRGLENLDPEQAYLFVFNHINIFDHIFIISRLKRPIQGVEKAAHFKWPVYGYLLKRTGQIPIAPRGDTRQAIEALEKLRRYLSLGASIIIAPEGTRTVDGHLQPFRKGAFHLALQARATIVPIILKGSYEFMRKGEWCVYPTTVEIVIEEPISTADYSESDVEVLRDRVYSIYQKQLYGTAAKHADAGSA